MDRKTMIERLEWLSTAGHGAQADWLPDNMWHLGIQQVAKAALDELAELDRTKGLLNQLLEEWCWRPIAEAPIPPVREAPDGYIFHCLIQTTGGVVGEGCARYVSDGRVKGSRNIRILRWYFGDGSRNCGVCHDPRYFMPLPAKRED